eukprot:m.1202341 g.1202341  ORF g.1202341 m.1202341 type:complete len:177 (+) comp24576_c0_seq51:309-839(+)
MEGSLPFTLTANAPDSAQPKRGPDRSTPGSPTARPDSLFVDENAWSKADSGAFPIPRKDSILTSGASITMSGMSPAIPETGRSLASSPDAEWAEEYAFVGDNEGRKKLATLARKTTQQNPWKMVPNNTVRMKRKPSTEDLNSILDDDARKKYAQKGAFKPWGEGGEYLPRSKTLTA